MFTRQGFSPDVTFPRILGIEAVGEVEQDPSGHYQAGQKVAAVMGGMGRQYNGGVEGFWGRRLFTLLPLTNTTFNSSLCSAALVIFTPLSSPSRQYFNIPR